MHFERQHSIQHIPCGLSSQHMYLMATSVVLNVQGNNEMDERGNDTEQQG